MKTQWCCHEQPSLFLMVTKSHIISQEPHVNNDPEELTLPVETEPFACYKQI